MPSPNAEIDTGKDELAEAVSAIGAGLGFEDDEEDSDDDLGLGETTSETEVEDVVVKEPGAAAEPGVTPAPAAAAVDAAPATWRKEASATWAQLPSEAKAEILKREADIFKGLETYKADATFARGIKHVLAPYEQIMQQSGVNPVQHISGLLQAHHILATGTPQSKLAFFQQLARDYRIDLGAPAADSDDAPYVDPTVLALRQDLEAVQSRLARSDQERQAAIVDENRRQVDSFAADPKNPYFNEVADDMVLLLNKGLAKTLQQAYDEAVWRNPVVRAKEIARTTAAAAQPATPVVTQVAKAKAATAANVKTSAKSGSATTPLGSLDDTLKETLAKINARA